MVSDDIRICFVGDSLVNGTGDETALGWSGRLCVAANQRRQITYYNLGIRRETSADIRQRWQRECAPRLPEGCDARVVLSYGVNDTVLEGDAPRVEAGQSLANMRSIVGSAGHYRMLMVGPPPVGDPEQNRRIARLSWAFAEEAKRLGIGYVELFTPLAVDTKYMREIGENDGAHPRSTGYARIAGIVGASPHWWF
jgi:acyl-CoA thioesterase-1